MRGRWGQWRSAAFASLALTVVALAVLPATVVAQGRASLDTLDRRLQRVERVVDQSLINLAQKVGEVQNEVRELRGEVENLGNDLQLLSRRNRDLYQDTDRRLLELESLSESLGPALEQLEALGGGGVLPDPFGPGETGSLPALPDSGGGVAAVIVPEGVGNAAARQPGDGPIPPAAPVTDNAARVATAAEQQAYKEAYDLLASGNNQEAVAGFDQFLIDYPEGPYSDNAWYWQGEAMYARRQFDKAIDNFAVVAELFPSSPKVPDARLKIGFALFEQQRYDEAREVLTGVQDDYPGRSASVLARKRLQEMTRDSQ